MISVDSLRSSTHMTVKISYNMISNIVSLNFIKVEHQIFVFNHSTNVHNQFNIYTCPIRYWINFHRSANRNCKSSN